MSGFHFSSSSLPRRTRNCGLCPSPRFFFLFPGRSGSFCSFPGNFPFGHRMNVDWFSFESCLRALCFPLNFFSPSPPPLPFLSPMAGREFRPNFPATSFAFRPHPVSPPSFPPVGVLVFQPGDCEFFPFRSRNTPPCWLPPWSGLGFLLLFFWRQPVSPSASLLIPESLSRTSPMVVLTSPLGSAGFLLPRPRAPATSFFPFLP